MWAFAACRSELLAAVSHRLLLAEENELLLSKLFAVLLELLLFLRQPFVEVPELTLERLHMRQIWSSYEIHHQGTGMTQGSQDLGHRLAD